MGLGGYDEGVCEGLFGNLSLINIFIHHSRSTVITLSVWRVREKAVDINWSFLAVTMDPSHGLEIIRRIPIHIIKNQS
jgi:hypothetical protein